MTPKAYESFCSSVMDLTMMNEAKLVLRCRATPSPILPDPKMEELVTGLPFVMFKFVHRKDDLDVQDAPAVSRV